MPQFVDGKILFVDGDVAMHEDCCCSDPCEDCTGTQDDITMSWASGYSCDNPQPTDTGVYVYNNFISISCVWIWVGPNGQSLTIDGEGNIIIDFASEYWEGTANVTCVGGVLTIGTFSVFRQFGSDEATCEMVGTL